MQCFKKYVNACYADIPQGILWHYRMFITLRPKQNGCHVEYNFKRIVLDKKMSSYFDWNIMYVYSQVSQWRWVFHTILWGIKTSPGPRCLLLSICQLAVAILRHEQISHSWINIYISFYAKSWICKCVSEIVTVELVYPFKPHWQ